MNKLKLWIKGVLKKKSNWILLLLLCFVIYQQFPLVINSFQRTGENLSVQILYKLSGDEVAFPPAEKTSVIFWATWCAPCHLQLELMNKMISSDEAKKKIYAISIGEDSKTVKKFLKKNPLPFTFLLDPHNRLRKEYSIKATPTVAYINKDKKIDYFSTGLSFYFILKQLF